MTGIYRMYIDPISTINAQLCPWKCPKKMILACQAWVRWSNYTTPSLVVSINYVTQRGGGGLSRFVATGLKIVRICVTSFMNAPFALFRPSSRRRKKSLLPPAWPQFTTLNLWLHLSTTTQLKNNSEQKVIYRYIGVQFLFVLDVAKLFVYV